MRSVHKIEPEVFRARFPEHPLCSERFSGFLAAHNVRKVNECLHYRLEVAGCPMTAHYGIEHPLIPQPDPTFVWPLTRGIVRAQSGPLNMLGYMHILRCRDQRYYFGSTNDLIRRLADHRAGRVRSTKPRLPVELVHFEECQTPDLARQRERSFKKGRTRRKRIDLLIRSFPRDRLTPFA